MTVSGSSWLSPLYGFMGMYLDGFSLTWSMKVGVDDSNGIWNDSGDIGKKSNSPGGLITLLSALSSSSNTDICLLHETRIAARDFKKI
jgi:hypothetical protein